MVHRTQWQGKGDEKLNKTVDRVLNQVLGHDATVAFYGHLENTHSIRRHEIARQLDLFNSALKEYFGAGAAIIENMIYRNMELAGAEEETGNGLLERAKILKLA